MKRFAALVLAGVCALIAASWSAGAAGQEEAGEATDGGRRLFEESCASCHGPGGEGTDLGPSLSSAGAASADFQLRTGRMPLVSPGAQTVRKPPAFEESEIDELVDYVASLGDGPSIPSVTGFETADVAAGAELFNANCAACHGATGNGGAVGGDAFAPSLMSSKPVVVAEAMIVGPGEMPPFGFSEPDRDAIVRYVRHIQTTAAPGGLDLGGVGPVPEGFVAWFVGMVALVAVSVAIGRGRRTAAEEDR